MTSGRFTESFPRWTCSSSLLGLRRPISMGRGNLFVWWDQTMSNLSAAAMRAYLGRSISSLNLNKLRGLLAEVELRRYLRELGFDGRVSPGGWIARREGAGEFGHNTVVLFPEIVRPGRDLPPERAFPQPPLGLHTICATFHQSGIHAYYCCATIGTQDDPLSIRWRSIQLGLPVEQPYLGFPDSIPNFRSRTRAYNFLRYHTDSTVIPDEPLPEEFSKEHLRVTFQGQFMSEMSDVDGIFWGQQLTYPLEIKEKTVAVDRALGPYFGLDLGPFVKLAFYAAKRGNLHSLFIVREIDSVETRALVNWWFITFDRLAQFASWVPQGGGMNMGGGQSTVVRIPKAEFQSLTREALAAL